MPESTLGEEPEGTLQDGALEEPAAPDPDLGNDPADTMYVDISYALVDPGELETCADVGISFLSLEDGAIDLRGGAYPYWIDRVDLPQYAADFIMCLQKARIMMGTMTF